MITNLNLRIDHTCNDDCGITPGDYAAAERFGCNPEDFHVFSTEYVGVLFEVFDKMKEDNV